MSTADHFDFVQAGPLDRPALARLCPTWFQSHRCELGWCAVAEGEIFAAVMLDFAPTGVVSLDLHGCDDTFSEAIGTTLLDRAITAARAAGATALDAEVTSMAAVHHEAMLRTVMAALEAGDVAADAAAPAPAPVLDVDEDEDELDMGFDLFD